MNPCKDSFPSGICKSGQQPIQEYQMTRTTLQISTPSQNCNTVSDTFDHRTGNTTQLLSGVRGCLPWTNTATSKEAAVTSVYSVFTVRYRLSWTLRAVDTNKGSNRSTEPFPLSAVDVRDGVRMCLTVEQWRLMLTYLKEQRTIQTHLIQFLPLFTLRSYDASPVTTRGHVIRPDFPLGLWHHVCSEEQTRVQTSAFTDASHDSRRVCRDNQLIPRHLSSSQSKIKHFPSHGPISSGPVQPLISGSSQSSLTSWRSI